MSSYTLRILERTDDGGVLTFTGCDDGDTTIYTSTVTGSAPPTGGNPPAGIGATILEVLQIPLLDQADDTPGLYVACGSAQTSWPGCALYRSSDGGTTFVELQNISQRATMGAADTLLAAWGGGNVVDPGGLKVTLLPGGELESITHAQLLAGGNLALIGDEIVGFRTATLVSGTTYTLTGLLRGRRGTESAQATHTAGERFVLLDEAITRVDSPLSLRGVAVTYRAVSFGNASTSGHDVTVTETQRSLEPLAPKGLAVGYAGTSGYTAQWTRQTRYPAEWADGADAPLGEATERYRFRVWHSTTYLVDVETTSPTYTFGAGSDLTYYSVSVQQVSDRLGLGAAATTTIG